MLPRNRSYKPLLLAALVSLALLVTGCGPKSDGAVARLNEKGNEAFAEGTYDQALAAYHSAQEKAPELAEPFYNAANALYRGQAYGEAQAQMQGALERTAKDELAQGGHYNLGNTAFQTEDWESAVEAYKQALILDPEDHDAKYNLELALQRLQEQQQQQQQEQQDQEQQKQEQEQSPGGEGEEQQEQTPDQSQDGSKGEQENEQDQSQSGEEQEEKSQDAEGEQQEQQNEAAGQPQDRDNESDSEPRADQVPPTGQIPPPGQKLTDEQAKQLLAAIAQDAKTLQEQLGQMLIVPNRPSGQDW